MQEASVILLLLCYALPLYYVPSLSSPPYLVGTLWLRITSHAKGPRFPKSVGLMSYSSFRKESVDDVWKEETHSKKKKEKLKLEGDWTNPLATAFKADQ